MLRNFVLHTSKKQQAETRQYIISTHVWKRRSRNGTYCTGATTPGESAVPHIFMTFDVMRPGG